MGGSIKVLGRVMKDAFVTSHVCAKGGEGPGHPGPLSWDWGGVIVSTGS